MFRPSIFCAEAMDWFIDFVWWYCYGFVCFCFCVVLLALLLTFLLQVIKLLTRSLVVLFCFVFPIAFDTNVCWYDLFLVPLTWIEIDSSIDWLIGLIDWLIDQRIDRLIDRLVVCRLVVGFVLLRALRPWALWPLRVSVGPSCFCKTDFSDGKVQYALLCP